MFIKLKDFAFAIFCLGLFGAIMNDGMHDRIAEFLIGCLVVCYIAVNEQRKDDKDYKKFWLDHLSKNKDEGGI